MTYCTAKTELLAKMRSDLSQVNIKNWDNITSAITAQKNNSPEVVHSSDKTFLKNIKKGIAFITFDYGIDGVSIEIEKYANCLERLFMDEDDDTVSMHFIGGDFYDKADTVLKLYWKRYKIAGMNGWSKWDSGKWFSKLFYEDMPEGSKIPDNMAKEIWD